MILRVLCFFFLGFVCNNIYGTVITYTLDQNALLVHKIDINLGKDLIKNRSFKKLINEADSYISKKVLPSVTLNKNILENQNQNDYVSFGRYWWPNENSKDGLPYILIDGKTNNTNLRNSDKIYIDEVSREIFVLGLAYYYTQDDKYAVFASEVLKCFFIDEDTKMAPNMEYAQIVPGKKDSGGAVIESAVFLDLIDGIQLIKSSDFIDTDVLKGVKDWFVDYLYWMDNSLKGKNDKKRINNLGTYNTLLRVVFNLFTENRVIAQDIYLNEVGVHIKNQISNDGSMPLELKRAIPLGYVKFNLLAYSMLINAGKCFSNNLLNEDPLLNKKLNSAFEWLGAFYDGEKEWTLSSEKSVIYDVDVEQYYSIEELSLLRFKVRRFYNYLDFLI
ncbi:alginate lyase family protein [Myroides odoratimimus]|uniref:alginate lyase family protein n=1 Tax=Myroides odoratimimus TaxID=76832 RepID=UPI002576C0C5|nr:alginate lyase family protein [Myroides odoratimimus]MDM1033765.1 alginate lyase family protein [Myroides odoratimimus]